MEELTAQRCLWHRPQRKLALVTRPELGFMASKVGEREAIKLGVRKLRHDLKPSVLGRGSLKPSCPLDRFPLRPGKRGCGPLPSGSYNHP